MAAKGADMYRLKQQEAALRTEFHAEYRQISPGAADVLDPAAVVRSLQSRATGGGTSATPAFLLSMERLGKAMQQHDSADLEAISYRPGIIDVRLSAPDVPTLNAIVQLVGETGDFIATIQSTDTSDNKVNSRIQIQAAAR
jgi:hypothetical protein